MLPAKVRAQKVTEKLIDPQGMNRWIAPVVARGVVNTTLQALRGTDAILIDDLDALIIRWTCRHLHLGQGINYNPFHGGGALCGNTMRVSAQQIRRLFREEGR